MSGNGVPGPKTRATPIASSLGPVELGACVGGIIPRSTPQTGCEAFARVFGPGTPLPDIVAFLRQRSGPMIEAWLERFRRHERLALARLLTLVGRGEHGRKSWPTGPGGEAGVRGGPHGSAGVGKSTLVGRLIEPPSAPVGSRWPCWRAIAQSPLSGGALLGDRFRMPSRPDDDGVFIRSLAAPSGHGALAEYLPRWCGCWRRSASSGG